VALVDLAPLFGNSVVASPAKDHVVPLLSREQLVKRGQVIPIFLSCGKLSFRKFFLCKLEAAWNLCQALCLLAKLEVEVGKAFGFLASLPWVLR